MSHGAAEGVYHQGGTMDDERSRTSESNSSTIIGETSRRIILLKYTDVVSCIGNSVCFIIKNLPLQELLNPATPAHCIEKNRRFLGKIWQFQNLELNLHRD